MPRTIIVSKIKEDKGVYETVIKRKRKNYLLAIILKENHGIFLKWVKPRLKGFFVDKNYYFVVPQSIYLSKNSIRTSLYLEGISTPIEHKYIEKITRKRTIETDDTKTEVEVQEIKGAKWDSHLIYMLLTRRLFDALTRGKTDIKTIILVILIIVVIALSVVGIVLPFTHK